MLTKQLRELESDGLIVRKVFPVVPPHVEYSLSEKGGTLKPILLALGDWGESYV
jgi:DNA-binding HxlR family transcriptional regulator